MARHLVSLTFDFDAMSGFVARGLTTPTPVSRGEFGAVGTERILELLARHEITATWFIPGVVIGTYPKLCEQISAAGHEIGHHGWTHVPPANLSRDEEEAGLARANEAITDLCGKPARGYRSPSWDLSPHTVELLLKHGFLYDSSMMGHDYLPYRARNGDEVSLDEPFVFGPETELVELPISWTLDDYPHFEFLRTANTILPGLTNANDVLSNWVDDFSLPAAGGGLGPTHLHLPPLRDRARAPNDDARAPNRPSTRGQRHLRHLGSGRTRVARGSDQRNLLIFLSYSPEIAMLSSLESHFDPLYGPSKETWFTGTALAIHFRGPN